MSKNIEKPSSSTRLRSAWRSSAEEVVVSLGVSQLEGLSSEEAARRLMSFGPNKLREREQRSTLRILVDQLRSSVVLLLVVAAGLSFWFGGAHEGLAIIVVIVLNTLIGFGVELRAVRSMDALRLLGSVQTRVRRDGQARMVDADQLVPGDILVLEGGDTVSADARLVSVSRLRVDESTFTGESVPVDKRVDVIEEGERIDQRLNMLFKGSSLTMGACVAVVVATGMETELGAISELTEGVESEITPLEKQLATVGNKLIVLTVVITIAVAGAGIWAGKPIRLMIESAVALAVATIPEGLPIVATIALARGLLRMAKRNALINKLSAVETLGAVSVLCTDKTGTLTENRMRLTKVVLQSGEVSLEGDFQAAQDLQAALEIGVLCNRAELGGAEDDSEAVGDPLEVALLLAGLHADLNHEQLTKKLPEIGSVAFDSESKLMATYHQREGGVLVAVKGAPEQVLAASTRFLDGSQEHQLDESSNRMWLARAEKMAERGLRVIAVARRRTVSSPDNAYEELTLVGLFGLLDPPRLKVRDAIKACRGAGVRVLMITGDHPATAGAIARAVGLAADGRQGEQPEVKLGVTLEDVDALSDMEREGILAADIFARVSPAQKLNLIRLHQEAGALVGMIGDGVNDAPALERANIGIAMGLRGTQVAREAAEMVLKDDSFSSVVAAIEQGRVIFGNIRKFVVYLLSCNISEVLVLSIAAVMKAPLPILPLQILFLNFVSDIFPALALGVGLGSSEVMGNQPRDPKEGILTRSHASWIVGFGVLITISVLSVFYLCLGPLELGRERAVTVSFLTLAFAQLWHVFNMRDRGTRFLHNEITHNPFVWGALVLCTGLLLFAVYVPFLAELLELTPPTAQEWGLVAGFSLLPVLIGQVLACRAVKRTGETR